MPNNFRPLIFQMVPRVELSCQQLRRQDGHVFQGGLLQFYREAQWRFVPSAPLLLFGRVLKESMARKTFACLSILRFKRNGTVSQGSKEAQRRVCKLHPNISSRPNHTALDRHGLTTAALGLPARGTVSSTRRACCKTPC